MVFHSHSHSYSHSHSHIPSFSSFIAIETQYVVNIILFFANALENSFVPESGVKLLQYVGSCVIACGMLVVLIITSVMLLNAYIVHE